MKNTWKWFDGDYKAYCTPEQYGRLILWKDVRHGSVYFLPDGGKAYDIIFPSKILNRVRRFLASKPRKTPKSERCETTT